VVSSDRRNAIRQFHEEKAREFYEREGNLQLYSVEVFPGFLIGSLVIETDDLSERVKLIPRLQKINQNVPKTILDTFDRHLWYSQYNLSDIFVTRVPIDELDSFAILIKGHFHDWWDNGCALLEVFDEQGIPMGAVADISFAFDDSSNIDWLDRQLSGDDYFQLAPPYPEDFLDRELQAEVGEPVWLLESNAKFFYLPDY
jgi:hypothetical protein